jgi:hypothetical protein
MEFALGFATGFLLLPWYWMSFLGLLLIVDTVLIENDCFGWTTTSLLVGVGLASWLGAGVNPLAWAFDNLADLVEFFLLFWLIGALWSVFKWYLFLLKIRDEAKDRAKRYGTKLERRPTYSYASENVWRITSWIVYWPLSMVGSLFGDILTRIVKTIFNVLSGLYEKMANSVFADFEE